MRKIVNDNYSNVTVMFDYHAGTGYVTAYYGGANSVRSNESLWLKPFSFAGNKSRDEAELRALMYVIGGSKNKTPGSYAGFTRSVRLQLEGFTSIAKGLNKSHKSNMAAWSAAIEALTNGNNGHTIDLVRVDEIYSNAIENAKIYAWKALNHDKNVAAFKAMVDSAKKTAKAAAAPKARTRSRLEAKIDAAMKAKTEPAAEAKVEAAA